MKKKLLKWPLRPNNGGRRPNTHCSYGPQVPHYWGGGAIFIFTLLCPALSFAQEAGEYDNALNTERPGFTNGASTVGKGNLHLETGITRSLGLNRFGDGGTLRYGTTDKTEWRIGLPVYQRGGGSDIFTTTALGVKHTIRPNIAVIATGTDLTNTHKRFAQVAVESEFVINEKWGLQLDIVRDRAWSSGVNFGYTESPRLAYFVEFYKQDGPHYDGGVTYKLSTNRQVDLSAGGGFVSVGYSIRTRF
jgi:hypothetical protein